MSDKKKKKSKKKRREEEELEDGVEEEEIEDEEEDILRELSPEEIADIGEEEGMPEYTIVEAMADVKNLYPTVIQDLINSSDPDQEIFSLQTEIKDLKRAVTMSAVAHAFWSSKIAATMMAVINEVKKIKPSQTVDE